MIRFADLQVAIADLPLTVPESDSHSNVDALARSAKIFDLPVVISTVPAGEGSAATVVPEIFARLGQQPVLQRKTPESFNA